VLAQRSGRGGHDRHGGGAATRPSGLSSLGARSGISLTLVLLVRGMRGGSHGTDVHHGVDARTPRTIRIPYLTRQMSKCFMTLSPAQLLELPAVVHCWRGLGLSRDRAKEEARWAQGFTWFGPSERNTLHPWRVLLYCCVCAVQAES
jgi:hypothetical protein